MFIGHTQPADALAARQAHLVGRVDLPGIVRVAGPWGAAPAGGCRREARVGHPTLDGACLRQVGVGEAARQVDAQEAGPPTRVVAPQGKKVGDVVGVRSCPPGAIARRMRAGGDTKGTQQVADGANGEPEPCRESDGVGLVVGSLP